jgi:hypothetical protein
VADSSAVGSFPSATYTFEPANHDVLQVQRFSRLLVGEAVPTWPIEDAQDSWQTLP